MSVDPWLILLSFVPALAFGALAAMLGQRNAQLRSRLHEKDLALTEARARGEERVRSQEEFTRMAEASVLEAGAKLSNKLLEDHKREIESARKNQEEATRKTTEALTKDFKTISEVVAALRAETKQNGEKLGTVWQALSAPASVGQMTEIGLENALRQLGLEPARDFIMQYAIAGDGERGALRPDAVLFLPQDQVLVIDCKASTAWLELARAENEGAAALAETRARLTTAMQKHVNDLLRKDYRSAVEKACREAGRPRAAVMLTVMYLPSETAIEHLAQAEPAFRLKAEQAGIILAGPASLAALLRVAGAQIGLVRQAENQERILTAVESLMESVASMLSHVEKVGRGMKSAIEALADFTGSVNRRVLPRMRALETLGVSVKKQKQPVPTSIPSYELRMREDVLVLEAEVASAGDVVDLPAPRKLAEG